MFRAAQCPFLRAIGTEQNRQFVRIFLSARLLREIECRFHHILQHVVVYLRCSDIYIDVGSFLQLVLGRFNSQRNAPDGEHSFSIANESKDVMKHNASTVWEAMMYLLSVRLVHRGRTVQQRVPIFYKTGMRVALATQSVFHAWKAILQEAEQSYSAFSAHPYPFYDKL